MATRQQESTEKERPREASVQVSEPRQEMVTQGERTPRASLARQERSTPFSVMRRLMDDMDRLFEGFRFGPSALASPFGAFELMGGGELWGPEMETFERDGKLVLRMDIPGIRREDVHVDVLGNELVVSGERKREQEETRGGRYYSERRYGSFERRIALPSGITPESIDASYDDGVLEISVAVPGRETRKIEVRSKTGKEPEGSPSGAVH